MTCVLGMIVSREREIKNFVKTPYYKIIGEFGEENTFKAEWKVTEKSKMNNSPKLYNENGFKKEEDAKDFILSLERKTSQNLRSKKSKKQRKCPIIIQFSRNSKRMHQKI